MYKKSRFYTLTPLPTNFSLCVITAVKNQRISWQNRVAIRSFWNFIPKIKWFDHFFALLNIEENKTLTKTLNSCDLVYKKWASNLAAVTYNLAFKRMMWWRWPSSWPSTPSSPTRTRSSTTLKFGTRIQPRSYPQIRQILFSKNRFSLFFLPTK